jgi:sugar transferase (PEP-CTERM system associated)
VIRLFNVYYPVRTLVLLVGEALIVLLSFVLGVWAAAWMAEVGFPRPTLLQSREGPPLLLLLAVTGIVLLLSHGLDLYDSDSLSNKWYLTFRLLMVVGLVAFSLAAIAFVYRQFRPGRDFFPGASLGLVVLTISMFVWRALYSWLVQHPYFRERVYVLGTGDRAQRVLNGLRLRPELGIEVAGWTGNIVGELSRDAMAEHMIGLVRQNGVHRVIVAMPDRREKLPVEELLELRLAGVKVEEATSWLEKIYHRVEVEQLYPSWLIFAEGFRFSIFFRMLRGVLNFSVALLGLVLALPLLPFIWIAVKASSAGPALYHQMRVGKRGKTFYCLKFRTMRQDAEADTGATWATDDDPRITRVGKFLRTSRLDEIPQLWCVLKRDMNFVGPRPERPEFVEWLKETIPYYDVRHMVRPGITGWAQVKYKYGNTVEDAREKLQYDLFYIKNASLGLDLKIWFETVKIVLRGRGAK